MSKRARTLLIVAAVAVAAYLAWRWYQNRQANAGTTSPTGSFGTNLNSVAPELVGGSAGPSIGPALSVPVNITLTESVAPPPADMGDDMLGANTSPLSPVKTQNRAASINGSQPDKTAEIAKTVGESTGAGVPPPGTSTGPRRPAPKPVSSQPFKRAA